MVQGWQRRAEIAVARRVESKQRKQKKSHRANVKGMVSNLLAQMDKFHCSRVVVSERTVLHVWTEQDATLDMVERSHCKHEERGSEERQKQEHDSELGSNSKRRVRGLSSSSSSSSNNNNSLCRTHFYKAKCANASASANSKQGSGKKVTGCRHVHPAKHFKTLGDIAGQAQSALLDAAEAAFVEATHDDTDEDLGGMEMLNYFSIRLDEEGKRNADGDRETVGQVFTKALRDHSCINASLVYVAFGNALIFDRYQEGLLMAELGTVLAEGKRITSNSESSQGNTLTGAECLPAAVLEYILTFLPDTSVASMARVCTTWHSEIGKSSSYLWRQMLERRKWPLPTENPSLLLSTRTHEAKCCFQMHYQVVRDVNAVKEALSALVNSKRLAPANDVEMVYQAFSTRRTAPSEPNSCVAVEVWSPDEVLAAYSHDCTIRLFKAVAKGPAGGMTCRELISVCLNPYRKTSKVKARLVAIGLDTDMVACLLHVQGGSVKSTSILSIIQRDNYLEAAGGDSSSLGWSELEEGVLNVIDINAVIVDFVLSHADDMSPHLLNIFGFDGYDLADVQVVVSDSLVACGNGKFAIEAAIYIPDPDLENEDDDDDDDDEVPRIMLGRKLVVISSLRGTVAWMGDLPWTLVPNNCNIFLTGCVLEGNPGRTASCRIIAATPSKLSTLHADINNTSEICDGIHSNDAADTVVAEILSLEQREWQIDRERRRHVAALPGGSIVATDILFKDRGNGFRDHRSCISFVSMGLAEECTRHEPLWLNHCEVLQMHRLRDEHVLLVCEEVDVNADDSDADPFDEVDGHWFSADPQRYIRGIIVHVTSRQVIYRAHFPFDISEGATSLSLCCGFGNTIAVGLSWKGVVLTGANVRAVGSCNSQQSKERLGNEADKKKKLARQIYSRKKEGRRAPRCSS